MTPLAYGTWLFSGDWGPVDEHAAIAAIQHARSLGINFFDTAQAYGFGASERLLGAALSDKIRGERDKIVIATKGGLRQTDKGLVRDASPAWLRKGIEESLRAPHRPRGPQPGSLARSEDAICRDGISKVATSFRMIAP